ncbi:MAG TPA: cytochrome c [Thermoanaerobaculia bacterium]|nr:cytochrome c [Thermoanaerobaculia bacterium]
MKLRTVLAVALPLLALSWAGCAHQDLSGPEIYSTYCARCHGDQGRGKGDADSLILYPHLNLLTSPMVRSGDRAAVARRIREGYGPMPGFARRLDAREVERLVDFTFQLGRETRERP